MIGPEGATFALSGYSAYDGIVSGGGDLQMNSGFMVMKAASAQYTGVTIINGGTVKFQGSSFDESPATLRIDINAGQLYWGGDLTYGGDISGSGGMVHEFDGTTVLLGEIFHTGGTVINAGALQIGNGGDTGLLGGNVELTNGGTLRFDRSDDFNYNGAISGDGLVVKLGGGTAIFTNDHTYTGGTVVEEGALQLGDAGYTTGMIQGSVTLMSNTRLIFQRDNEGTFSGTISGEGSLGQNGAMTTLTGNNSYTGGTMVDYGALQLGNGGTTGMITGDVTVMFNTALIFNHSDDIAFAGTINGEGGVRQLGTGTTTLTANHSYEGGTFIEGGALQLGNGGTTGMITGDVTLSNHSTLRFNRSDALIFSGHIDGEGGVSVFGGNKVTLTEQNTYTDGTLIQDGAIFIADVGDSASVLGSGAVDVSAAGTLGGNGTVLGDATVAGTLSPGNSPGTLHFAQALTLTNDAVVKMEIASTSVFDLIVVDGLLTYGGELQISFLNGFAPATGQVYQLFTANNIASGSQFDRVSISGAEGTFDAGTGQLLITVPEPGTLTLLGLGVLILLRRRRLRAG